VLYMADRATGVHAEPLHDRPLSEFGGAPSGARLADVHACVVLRLDRTDWNAARVPRARWPILIRTTVPCLRGRAQMHSLSLEELFMEGSANDCVPIRAPDRRHGEGLRACGAEHSVPLFVVSGHTHLALGLAIPR